MNKILVVDDDLDILTLMKITLSLNDFIVEAVSDWKNIDSSLANFKPDLILLDVSLEGADGREICKKLKRSEETRHIPVIIFSANAEMGETIKDCNAQDFIAKPYELSHLLKTIRLYLN